MEYRLNSFVQTANGHWTYRINTACFAWYPWSNGIQRIIYPLTVNSKADRGDVEHYLNAIQYELPDGMEFLYKWNDNPDYAGYWEMDGSQLLMIDIRLSGEGQRRCYGLALLTMLRYLREKPEIPFLYTQYAGQQRWPKHWGILACLAYLQIKYKEMGTFSRPNTRYGHALLEYEVKTFCRNWDEFAFRKAFSGDESIARAMQGGSAHVKDVTLDCSTGPSFSDICGDDSAPRFAAREFPEFGIPKIKYVS
jgi:hypothetical protein